MTTISNAEVRYSAHKATYTTSYSTFCRKNPEHTVSFRHCNSPWSSSMNPGVSKKESSLSQQKEISEYMKQFSYPVKSEVTVHNKKLATVLFKETAAHKGYINSSECSAVKYVDPYISTSHLVVELPTKHCKVEHIVPTREGYQPVSSKFHRPIYDRSVFHTKPTFRNWTVPARNLPHSGKLSETSYQYKYPTVVNNQITHYTPNQEKIKPHSAAAINYFTEYDHIGRKWPVRTVLNPG